MFVLNGFDDLESFREISESDLDFLKVTDATQREKLLVAAESLADDTTSSVSGNIEISYFWRSLKSRLSIKATIKLLKINI